MESKFIENKNRRVHLISINSTKFIGIRTYLYRTGTGSNVVGHETVYNSFSDMLKKEQDWINK